MGKKILLADDSITIQKVIELTFSDEDFEVVTVGNGRLAVEKVQEVRPDVVLCDVIMPEKDGYEVCEFIKKTPGLAQTPVLLLTGAFEPFDQERAARVGCDGFLAKPFEPETLIAQGEGPAGQGGGPAGASRRHRTGAVQPPSWMLRRAPPAPVGPVPPPMAPPPPAFAPPPPVPSRPPPLPAAPEPEMAFIPDEPFEDLDAPPYAAATAPPMRRPSRRPRSLRHAPARRSRAGAGRRAACRSRRRRASPWPAPGGRGVDRDVPGRFASVEHAHGTARARSSGARGDACGQRSTSVGHERGADLRGGDRGGPRSRSPR